MRILCRFVVTLSLVAAGVALLSSQAPDPSKVLADAREALGGDKKLSAVKTFIATGRTRQLRGNNLVPIVFEINCELPDKFVRTDEFPAQDTDPTTLGFNGNELIQFPPPPAAPAGRPGGAPAPAGRGPGPAAPDGARGAGPAAPPVSPAQQRMLTVKQDFARLMLGMFASSFPAYPLTFRYAGEGDAPEGKADVLDVSGPANFSARLVVQRDTRLPVMLMWQLPATAVVLRIPGLPMPPVLPPGAVIVDAPAPPASTATQEERDQYAATINGLRRQALAQAKPVDYRMYYADFRDVDGLKLPFRLRRAVGGETIEETTLDRYRLNAPIDSRKFQVLK